MASLQLPDACGTCITALYVSNISVWIMSGDARSLDEVRAEIDDIDAQMRDLVIRRMTLISEVSAAKQRSGSAALHPSREATIMRNLVQQHAGPPSPAILLRIWREIINSATALQGRLNVAVCAPEKSVGYWDMARNHFGTDTPMTLHHSPLDVLRRMSEERGTVGILPVPQEGEEDPWWPGLASESNGSSRPRIIWRLPFYASESGRFENLAAFALAEIDPQPSGDDVTVVIVETDQNVSRARIVDSLQSMQITARMAAVYQDDVAQRRSHLLELKGFIAESDPCWEIYAEKIGEPLQRIAVVGAYPAPLIPLTADWSR
tara:strand:- start:1902 stop:2861 length:960 start_codon:yes stop_codon:yes gene_type:complete